MIIILQGFTSSIVIFKLILFFPRLTLLVIMLCSSDLSLEGFIFIKNFFVRKIIYFEVLLSLALLIGLIRDLELFF